MGTYTGPCGRNLFLADHNAYAPKHGHLEVMSTHHGPLIDRALSARWIYTLGIFGTGRLGLLPTHRARRVVFVPPFETPGVKHVVARRLEGFALVERGIAHGALH
jgi:hypothetical protein